MIKVCSKRSGADNGVERVASPPGCVRVRERVADKVIREASAAAIGVSRGDVKTEAVEQGGGLAVRITCKFPIPNLADGEAARKTIPILEKAQAVREALAKELSHLVGQTVHTVSIVVTGAIVLNTKRVN